MFAGATSVFSDNRLVLFLILILTSFAVIRILWNNPLSVDSYTHIAIGEQVLQTNTVPTHQDLSYKLTDPSLEWISHSWLADVLLYMGQSISLRTGVVIVLFPFLALSAYLVFLLLPRPRLTLLNLLFLSVTMIIAAGFWRYHPFIFMVPLQLSLMVTIRKWQEGNTGALTVIPLIFLLWANMAGGYIIIPALYCLIAGIALFLHRRIERPHHPLRFRAYMLAVIVGLALTLCNPYGIRIWMYWLTVIAVVYQNRSFSSLIGALSTYNQTSTRQVYSSIYLVLFAAYSGLITIRLISALIRSGQSAWVRILPYLPHLMLVILGYGWVRFIPLSVFILLPLTVETLSEIYHVKTNQPKRKSFFFAFLVGCFILLSLSLIISPPNTPTPRTPHRLAEVIREVSVPENILTTYDNTGYIMYTNPEYKVLLDAQDDLMDDGSLITNYQPVGNFAFAFQKIRETQGIHTAVISRDVSGLSQTLAMDTTWALIYFDDNGAIFVDTNAIEATKLAPLELTYVDLDKNLGFSPESATQSARELETFLTRYPENYFAVGQLATVHRILRQYDRAHTLLQSIPKPLWTFATYTELGRLEAARGRCKSAEDAFLTALTYRNEKNYSRTVLDIAVLYAGCMGDKAKAKHFFQRYNSFLVTTTEREKLNSLAKQFGIDFSD